MVSGAGLEDPSFLRTGYRLPAGFHQTNCLYLVAFSTRRGQAPAQILPHDPRAQCQRERTCIRVALATLTMHFRTSHPG